MCKLQSEIPQLTGSRSSSYSHPPGCLDHLRPEAPCHLWTRIRLQTDGRLHSRVQWHPLCPPFSCCLTLTEDWISSRQLMKKKMNTEISKLKKNASITGFSEVFTPTFNVEHSGIPDSVSYEGDLCFILCHATFMDHHWVLCLIVLYWISSAVLQLSTIEKPGSNHWGRQFNG